MKILVAPLDWGLGHATRTIPLVRKFLAQGAEVDLAVSGKMSALYRGEFPDLTQIEIPGYGIRYPKRGFEMPFWLLANYLRIMRDSARTRDSGKPCQGTRIRCHSFGQSLWLPCGGYEEYLHDAPAAHRLSGTVCRVRKPGGRLAQAKDAGF